MTVLEVFLISQAVYLYLTVLLRIFGKKEFSQLNVFDFAVFLIIAEIMTDTIGNDDFPFLYGVVATSTLIVIDRIVSKITLNSKKLRDIFEGRPSYIIYKGELIQESMRKQRYTIDDLAHHLRENSIDSISKVEFALLETNGSLSIITKKDCCVELPDALIVDGVINEDNLKLLDLTKEWLLKELKKQNIDDIKDVFYCILEKEKLLVIKK